MRDKSRSGLLVAVWAVLLSTGTLLALAVSGAGPLPGDLALARLIQQPGMDGLAISLLVHADYVLWVLAPLAVLVALVKRWWLGAFFVSLAVATGKLIPDGIKPLAARPRPSAEVVVRVLGPSEDYGFPSTTAFFAAVFFGMIAYLIWRVWPRRPVTVVVSGLSLLLVIATGVSRVYAGEHWPTDVLGGWLLGGAWLGVLVVVHHRCLSLWMADSEAAVPTRRRKPVRR